MGGYKMLCNPDVRVGLSGDLVRIRDFQGFYHQERTVRSPSDLYLTPLRPLGIRELTFFPIHCRGSCVSVLSPLFCVVIGRLSRCATGALGG